MRHILAASILISPLFLSAAALSSQPVTDATAATTRPLSTGVKPPHVLDPPRIELTPAATNTLLNNAEVVLKLNVDENGRAQDVQVVKSPNHFLDEPVADAVRQTRFSPAMLDHQPIATDVTLTVVVLH
jgi:TonB family protein